MATILKEEEKKNNIAYVNVCHINIFVYIFEKNKDNQNNHLKIHWFFHETQRFFEVFEIPKMNGSLVLLFYKTWDLKSIF